MKKYTLILGFGLLLAGYGSAQQVPSIAYPPNGGQTDPNFWSRAGNLGNGANNQNNLFGTKWNSPIYTVTGNNFNVTKKSGNHQILRKKTLEGLY